jgi:hypothetical protein
LQKDRLEVRTGSSLLSFSINIIRRNKLPHAQLGQIRFHEILLTANAERVGKINRITHVQPSAFRKQNFSRRISPSWNQAFTYIDPDLQRSTWIIWIIWLPGCFYYVLTRFFFCLNLSDGCVFGHWQKNLVCLV